MAEEKDMKQEEVPQQEAPQQETAQEETIKDEAQDTEKTDKKSSKKEQKKEAKKLEELEKKLKEAEDKAQKEKDDYMRLMAEFETFRRRSAEDRLQLISSASADTIKGLLPVLDDCERAMAILEGSSDDAAVEGTQLIYNKLTAYLKSKGLTRIEAKGEEFNTDFHEAVAQFPASSDDMKNKIIDVVQQGYMLGGKVVRFAKVVVGI